MRGATATALLLMVLAPPPALAESGARTVVIEFTAEGDLPEAVSSRISQGFQAGLASGLSVVSLAALKQAVEGRAPDLAGCVEGECLSKLGTLVGGRVAVRLKTKAEFESYYFTVEGIDVANGESLLLKEAACEICTIVEASNSATQIAEGFARELAPQMAALPPLGRPAPAVTVSSRPPGALVKIDGKPAGTADLTVTLPPGVYTFDVTLAGFEPVKRRVRIIDRHPKVRVDFMMEKTLPPPDLSKAPTAPPAPDPAASKPAWAPPSDRLPYGALAFASLGTGLVLLGGGAYLMGLDGQITCSDGTPKEHCATVYDTGVAGLSTVIVGSVALLSAVTLFVLEQAAQGVGPDTEPSVTPPTARRWPSLSPWADPATGAGGLLLVGSLP